MKHGNGGVVPDVTKTALTHIREVIQRILFIGFTVQILLGIAWMCRNMMQVQDYGRMYLWDGNKMTDGMYSVGGGYSFLYHGIFRVLGAYPPVIYVLQTICAFGAGYGILRKFLEKKYAVWGGLVLVTFPFALQCHFAVLPFSFFSSLILFMFSFLHGIKPGGKHLGSLVPAVGCGVLALVLWCGGEPQDDGAAGRSMEAIMASRLAWPTLWVDFDRWPEEIQEATVDVALEATYYPDNMKLLDDALVSGAGAEKAKEYYRKIGRVAWEYHKSMIIRQVGWDVLGYGATAIIFRMQLEGKSYDSYTGRNYEAMRGNSPILTKYYVEYGCWWFGCCLILTVILTLLRMRERRRVPWGMIFLDISISGILIVALTMRGAGMMDYKYTVAVNALWLIWSLVAAYCPGAQVTHSDG